MNRLIAVAFAAFVVTISTIAAQAQTADEFFRNRKEITILVGSVPGGSYDAYSRAAGRYMSKYLPGNPNFVINNMPGGGGICAANFLYNVAPKDGSVIMIMARSLPTAPLLYGEESKAQFDTVKFNWIGSMVKEMGMGAVSNRSPAKTLEDMKKHEVVLGASGIETDPAMFARMFNYLYGTKFKVIAGYQGQAEVLGAVEKGELHGLFLSGWSGTGRAFVKDHIASSQWTIFVQMGLEKDPEFPNIPTIMDVIKDPKDHAALNFLFSRQILGEPFAAPPDMAADRVAMLRRAFQQALEDKALWDEMDRQRFLLSPVFGEEAQRIMGELMATPPDVIERAKALVKIGL